MSTRSTFRLGRTASARDRFEVAVNSLWICRFWLNWYVDVSRGLTVGPERNTMSEYLILIYEDESAWSNPAPDAFDEMMKGHQVFGERNASSLRGGNALQPTSTATSLRTNGSGEFVVTDGAFAETNYVFQSTPTLIHWCRPRHLRRDEGHERARRSDE